MEHNKASSPRSPREPRINKANFTEMSRKKLKSYIRQHPTDEDAIRELFVNRKSPNPRSYPFSYMIGGGNLDAIFQREPSSDSSN
ncbi:DUF6887 family protein [Pannus brasiliensis]